jgi:hypothetical protein
MIMMTYGSPSSLQLTGHAHFWHPTGLSRTPARLAQLFELYDVKPRQRAAADLHETSGVMQSAEVDGRESHRVGKR